jgi:hypothetical protein
MISINPAGAGLNWPNLKKEGTSARMNGFERRLKLAAYGF